MRTPAPPPRAPAPQAGQVVSYRRTPPGPPPRRGPLSLLGPARVPFRTRLLVVDQLARLATAGVSLPSALARISATLRPGRMRATIEQLRAATEAGRGLAGASEAVPGLFSESERGLIELGERTGRMADVLTRISSRWRGAQDVRQQLVAGITYPVLLMLSSALLMPLPALFQGGLRAYLAGAASTLAWLAGVAVAVALLPRAVSKLRLAGPLRELAWRLPLLKAIYRRQVLVDVTHTLSTALAAGLGVQESLQLARGATTDPTANRALTDAGRGIAAGGELATSFALTGLLPEATLVALAGGEQSGTLPDALGRIADDLDHELRTVLAVGVRVAGITLLLLVTGLVGLRVMNQATSTLLPGGNVPGMNEVLEEMQRSPALRPIPKPPF